MLWLFLSVFVVLVFFLITRRNKRMVLLFNQLSCDIPEWPIIGHVYIFLDVMNSIQMLGREATSKGGLMAIWKVNVLCLMVTDAVTSEYILKYCLEKGSFSQLISNVTGNSSIFAPVSIWRPRRKLNTPTFAHNKLKNYVNIFSKQSEILVGKLKAVANKEPISIWEYLRNYTLDAVCESTLGVEVNAQKDPNHPFLVGITELFQVAEEIFNKPWLHNDFLYRIVYPKITKNKKIVYNFIEKVIEERRKSAEVHDTAEINIKSDFSKSFLSMMINSSHKELGFSDLALKEEAFLLIGAANDTSAVGLAFTTIMLSRFSDIQEKVYQELHETFGDSDRPVTAGDLLNLKYLEAVIKESLRLYPPVPVIERKVHCDITLPSGITLLKGCETWINIWALHRNPMYWGPDAEEFRPERFIEAPLKHPAAFIPFSCGPRGCLGYQFAYMSMKTTLANILRRFRILPAPHPVTGEIPSNDERLKTKYQIMLRHVDNYMVCLENRF